MKEPKVIEREKYTEEDYDDFLDEISGDVVIGSLRYSASRVLKEIDPIAYNVGFSDFQEYEDVYVCPLCDTEHEDEDDAMYCCQEEEE